MCPVQIPKLRRPTLSTVVKMLAAATPGFGRGVAHQSDHWSPHLPAPISPTDGRPFTPLMLQPPRELRQPNAGE